VTAPRDDSSPARGSDLPPPPIRCSDRVPAPGALEDSIGAERLDLRRVREAYNAKHGASILRDSDRFYSGMARRIVEGVAAERRGSACLLDAGCGGGFLLREVLRAAPRDFRAVCGLDVSDAALAVARAEAPTARLVLGQGEQLPFPDQCFDAVACLGNLEHFLEPGAGARELARVARPGAAVWILLPNSFYSGDIWRVIRTGYGPNHHQVLERFATVNEWRDFLAANGLTVEQIEPYNRFKWWKRLLPRNLAYHFLFRARPSR
jgi:SAM-dependent methyltransferase